MHHALKKNQTIVNLHSEEVNLVNTVSIFTTSHQEFVPLPSDFKDIFQTTSFVCPDTRKLLEIYLIQNGMLLSLNLVPKIQSFLNLVGTIFPVFSSNFNRRKVLELCTCMHNNFKSTLKWKEGQLIAKEMSSVTEIDNDYFNCVISGDVDDELIIDQAEQDFEKFIDADLQGMFIM